MTTVLPLVALLLTATPAKADLIGAWSGGGFEFVFKADGTGTLKDSALSPAEPMKWKAAAGKLTVTQDGEPVAYAYKLEGSSLTVSGGDLEKAVSLSRGAAAKLAAGDCNASCAHFLKCAGNPNAQLQAQCLQTCAAAGYDPTFMGYFQTTDCATALSIIATLDQQARGMSQQSQQQTQQRRTRSKECEGCRWDGSSCAWYSQSNWGSNVAYSGAVISCSNACCGH